MPASFKRWEIPHKKMARDAAIHALFPNAPQPSSSALSGAFHGGRQAALKKLETVDGEAYGKTRNFLNGEVSHLSPYLRHGCITLKEAANSVRERFGRSAEKLLFEFAWREYWRTVWYAHGMAILHDMQAPKVSLTFHHLTDDIQTGHTGLPCMDHFIKTLADVGYLHNHARMWLAAYIVHWRKIDWQAAADWMHDQLLDGDYASNHLSWQWIASTFSHKPYFFNQENLAKYTDNQYCDTCTASCPFKDSYSNLEQKLFKPTQQPARQQKNTTIPIIANKAAGKQTLVWVHDEMLSSEHSLIKLTHEKVFIFDIAYYANWSINRLIFIADCLAEMHNVSVWVGDTSNILQNLNPELIITQDSPNHQLKQQISGYPSQWHAEEKVCDVALSKDEIKSFSRFWKIASQHYIGIGEKHKKFIKHS
jgi:deoxyribodipyrimidine photo-lyase